MENYANHGFILLIPIFLMSLGFIIAFFWTRQRQYLSVLWLAFAQLSAGSVMFVQSLIIPSIYISGHAAWWVICVHFYCIGTVY
jgi:hypothetical protein